MRGQGDLLEEGELVDLYGISYTNEVAFLREVIWHGSNVKIIEPEELRASLISLMKEVVS